MFIQALFTTVKDYSLYTHQIMNSLFKKKKIRDIEERRENHFVTSTLSVEVIKTSRD